MPIEQPSSHAMRMAAFEHVRTLTAIHGELTSDHLRQGFVVDGNRVPLVNPQRGIFKPHQMEFLLSIKTVFPRPGGRVWYEDQHEIHKSIYDATADVEYSFMGQDPAAADNQWMKAAAQHAIPIIYFLGVAPGRYQAIVPTFLTDWSASALRVRAYFGDAAQCSPIAPATEVERRYALRSVKQRLHQASFREAVVAAYQGRCALSGLPEPLLLDAAHIIADGDHLLGQPVVTNGIPLSKLHHAAFDSHLIGIDPDLKIHVAKRLLDLHDGPILEAMKRLAGGQLRLPLRSQDQPDRDRLAMRFSLFCAA